MDYLHVLAKSGLFLTFCICDRASGGRRENEEESQGLPAAGGLCPVHSDAGHVPDPCHHTTAQRGGMLSVLVHMHDVYIR